MNLAAKDIRHNFGRFALTTIGIVGGLLVALFALLLIPSLRMIAWPTRAAT